MQETRMRERLRERCQQAGASLLAGHSAIQSFRGEVEVKAKDAESPDELLSPLPPLSLPPAATAVLPGRAAPKDSPEDSPDDVSETTRKVASTRTRQPKTQAELGRQSVTEDDSP